MLLATLRGSTILVFRVSGEEIIQIGSIVNNDFGRIREVIQGPDGNIYFTTSNTDGIGNIQEGDDKVVKIFIN